MFSWIKAIRNSGTMKFTQEQCQQIAYGTEAVCHKIMLCNTSDPTVSTFFIHIMVGKISEDSLQEPCVSLACFHKNCTIKNQQKL